MLKPDEGCITIDGHEVFENIPAKKRFFYISDEQYFFNNTTPEEMMHYYRKVYQGFDEARFHKLMGNFGLDEKRKIHTFSKGMKKQVSVICGVCAGTDYLFCDETFDGLDPVMRQAVKSIFAADMEDRNLTPIIASHNLRELEDICDHVGLLHKGGILLSKDLDDMKLNIHKIQCVLKPDMKPEDLTSLDKVNVEQRGSLCTITVRGSRSEVEAVMASYEPVFFECIPCPWRKYSSVKRRWLVMTSGSLYFKLLKEDFREKAVGHCPGFSGIFLHSSHWAGPEHGECSQLQLL